MDAVTTVAVVIGTGHVIELSNTGHHSSLIVLLHHLASRDHQHLN